MECDGSTDKVKNRSESSFVSLPYQTPDKAGPHRGPGKGPKLAKESLIQEELELKCCMFCSHMGKRRLVPEPRRMWFLRLKGPPDGRVLLFDVLSNTALRNNTD